MELEWVRGQWLGPWLGLALGLGSALGASLAWAPELVLGWLLVGWWVWVLGYYHRPRHRRHRRHLRHHRVRRWLRIMTGLVKPRC